MRGPRVLLAGGEHQDVARRTAGVEQQVDGLVGGVERAVRGGGDQLDLRARERSSGRAACGCPAGAVGAGVRGAGRRGAGRNRGPAGWSGTRAEAARSGGPGTGRGVGAVRPAAGVARGPWALS